MILVLLGMLTYAALVLETGGGSWSLPIAAMPQFVYLAAAVAAMRVGGAGGILAGAIAGVPADVIQGGPLGLNVVLLANLTFLSQCLTSRRSGGSQIGAAALVLVYVSFAGASSTILRDVLAARITDVRPVCFVSVSRAGGTAAVYLLVVAASRVLVWSVRLMIPKRPMAVDRPRWAQ